MTTATIEWAEQVWNPIVGCTVHSAGCTNCYAMRMAARLEAMADAGSSSLAHYRGTTRKVNGNPAVAEAMGRSRAKNTHVWTGKLGFSEAALIAPLKRKKPTSCRVMCPCCRTSRRARWPLTRRKATSSSK